jgi:hypothetical protein
MLMGWEAYLSRRPRASFRARPRARFETRGCSPTYVQWSRDILTLYRISQHQTIEHEHEDEHEHEGMRAKIIGMRQRFNSFSTMDPCRELVQQQYGAESFWLARLRIPLERNRTSEFQS